jgi:hypothetical protein
MLYGGSAKTKRAEAGSMRFIASMQSPVMIFQSDMMVPRKRKWPGVDDTRATGKRKMSLMGKAADHRESVRGRGEALCVTASMFLPCGDSGRRGG